MRCDRLEIEPWLGAVALPTPAMQVVGQQLLSAGRVGCILVAGGHGSRLQYPGPKGTFPLSPVMHKTLFQLFAEKVLAAGRQVGRRLPLALMTSPENHGATAAYFAAQAACGLAPDQLTLFQQSDLPYLTATGTPVQDAAGQIVYGPAGNGWCLRHFVEQGLWQTWQAAGIAYVTFVMIDNPLADPFDAALIGYHASQGGDVTLKSTWRSDPAEKVGLIAARGGQLVVVEYSDLPPAISAARTATGALAYPYANLSIFCFSMDFIARCHAQRVWEAMPMHRLYKPLPTGEGVAWKGEHYIFDVLPWAEGTGVLLYPRESCFAPLKERQGPCGVAAVQAALLAADRRAYAAVTGIAPPADAHFELAQDFHYPTPALRQCWQGRPLPTGPYIIP